MNDLKFKILHAVNESNKTTEIITRTDISNQMINAGALPVDVLHAIDDLLEEHLIKYDGILVSVYTPLMVTGKGRDAIDSEQKRLANESTNPERPFYRTREFLVGSVTIPVVLFLLGILVNYLYP